MGREAVGQAMKAYPMHRDVNPAFGTFEWWKTEDGNILEVDFNVHVCETTVYPYDMEHDPIADRIPLSVRHKDMTGGMAMRELGYEPVEEDEDGTDWRRAPRGCGLPRPSAKAEAIRGWSRT